MISFPSVPSVKEADLPAAHTFVSFHPFIKGVFSQWHPTPFDLAGENYNCAEQYMMAAKASLFGDQESFDQIMRSDDPAVQKRLGAQVAPFEHGQWNRWRYHVVYTANHAKFSQNKGCLRQLANTAPAMLVEANPRDWNWGNGLQLDDPANQDPALWKGTNFLGRILTLIREQLVGQT